MYSIVSPGVKFGRPTCGTIKLGLPSSNTFGGNPRRALLAFSSSSSFQYLSVDLLVQFVKLFTVLRAELRPFVIRLRHSPFEFLELLAKKSPLKDGISIADDEYSIGFHLEGCREGSID